MIKVRKTMNRNKVKLLTALVMLPISFLYTHLLFEESKWNWAVFVVGGVIIILVEALNRERKPQPESFIWLGCLLANIFSYGLNLNSVWYDYQIMLFIHIFIIWWIISRCRCLLEDASSHMLPLDVLNGFVVIPFGNYLVSPALILQGISSAFKPKKDRRGYSVVQFLILVCCIALFVKSANLLSSADESFSGFFTQLAEKLGNLFDLELSYDFGARMFLMVPISCFLTGLIIGSADYQPEKKDGLLALADRFLNSIRKMEEKFWLVVIVIFSLLYLSFFVLQFSYLFSGFVSQLPDGFSVAEYARNGFFELCRVMTVNFALLWLSTRSVSEETLNSRRFRFAETALLIESLIFSLIALSKLGLYIRIYSFTPLRLQSSWLVTVLIAGCVLWICNILTGKKVFRKWMIFGAVSLSVLALI